MILKVKKRRNPLMNQGMNFNNFRKKYFGCWGGVDTENVLS
ncbi:hypothetical protein CIRMBP1256_02177 [Enterococcus cecorum]|nr:hypothetical protein CIRMBP1256_02177 [Enterococcus cecorum]